ncbi:MAG: hypothetical protein M1490_04375 [Candidatus Bathyarchaeota archaeon]|nr:hypothetical protein [Candidatus Bathyarchaeota archaeon]
MDKIHLALTLLSIAIIVVPIVGVVYAYRDNILGLVLPPELKSLASGNYSASRFQPPIPAGQPTYDPATNTFTFSFKFTNPLQNTISVDNISADVICKDHGVFLGNVSINQPMTIAPDETVTINALGGWTQAALDHFKTFHSGPEDDDVNVSFENLNINVAGVQVHMDELADAGWVPLPPR